MADKLGNKIRARREFNGKTKEHNAAAPHEKRIVAIGQWLEEIAQSKLPTALEKVLGDLEQQDERDHIEALSFTYNKKTSDLELSDIRATAGYLKLNQLCMDHDIRISVSPKGKKFTIDPSKPYRDVEASKKALDEIGIKYTESEDGWLHVSGDISLQPTNTSVRLRNFTELPDFRAVILEGSFLCQQNKLTTLLGAPHKVGGVFFCFHNNLFTLAGAPTEIGKGFFCSFNHLKSMEGGPKIIRGDLVCSRNELETLKGTPDEIGGMFVSSENNLTSLEFGPSKVGGKYECKDNKITNIMGMPKIIYGDFICSRNKIESLVGGPEEVHEDFNCSSNLLTSKEGAPKEVRGDSNYRSNPDLVEIKEEPPSKPLQENADTAPPEEPGDQQEEGAAIKVDGAEEEKATGDSEKSADNKSGVRSGLSRIFKIFAFWNGMKKSKDAEGARIEGEENKQIAASPETEVDASGEAPVVNKPVEPPKPK